MPPVPSSEAAALWPRIALAEVGSTNAEAARLRLEGQGAPFWVTALRQTQGRGRRGRTWVSEPGNLYASCLIEANQPLVRMAELPFVAGLALHRAVAGFLGRARPALTLKWPNDLLLAGAKLAGILIENVLEPDGGRIVIAGFGVNCRHHPADTPYRAGDLAEAGFAVEPDALFARLAAEFAAGIAEWRRPETGFDGVREAWLTVASGVGEPIAVRLGDEVLEGRFETIDCTGALVLAAGDGSRRAISAADVFFPGTSAFLPSQAARP